MTREDIITRRRELRVPDQFQDQWVTLADVEFNDGDWVSPIQKISNSATGPVLVGTHWLDAESVVGYRENLERLGYEPTLPFNRALDRILKSIRLTRRDIYITQACHFLPRRRQDRRLIVPPALMNRSIEAVTRQEVEGRRVIALGNAAQDALRSADVDCLVPCPHPSSSVRGRYEALKDALRRLVRSQRR